MPVRKLPILILLALLAVVLAGCGEDKPADGNTAVDKASPAQATATLAASPGAAETAAAGETVTGPVSSPTATQEPAPTEDLEAESQQAIDDLNEALKELDEAIQDANDIIDELDGLE